MQPFHLLIAVLLVGCSVASKSSHSNKKGVSYKKYSHRKPKQSVKKHSGSFSDYPDSLRSKEYDQYPLNQTTLKTERHSNGTRTIQVTKEPYKADKIKVSYKITDAYDAGEGTPRWALPNAISKDNIGYNGQSVGEWSKAAIRLGVLGKGSSTGISGGTRSGHISGSRRSSSSLLGYLGYPNGETVIPHSMGDGGWRKVIINKKTHSDGTIDVKWKVQESYGPASGTPVWATSSFKDYPAGIGYRGELLDEVRRGHKKVSSGGSGGLQNKLPVDKKPSSNKPPSNNKPSSNKPPSNNKPSSNNHPNKPLSNNKPSSNNPPSKKPPSNNKPLSNSKPPLKKSYSEKTTISNGSFTVRPGSSKLAKFKQYPMGTSTHPSDLPGGGKRLLTITKRKLADGYVEVKWEKKDTFVTGNKADFSNDDDGEWQTASSSLSLSL